MLPDLMLPWQPLGISLPEAAETRKLALDFGERRIGIAISDPQGILAKPYRIIDSTEIDGIVETVLAIAAEQEVDVIVVGLPVSLDGKEHGQAARVREFGNVLQTRSPVTVVYHDERFSTVTASCLM